MRAQIFEFAVSTQIACGPVTSKSRRPALAHMFWYSSPYAERSARPVKENGVDVEELGQADGTHWCLAGGTDVEILNVIDDPSRLLLSPAAFVTVQAATWSLAAPALASLVLIGVSITGVDVSDQPGSPWGAVGGEEFCQWPRAAQ